MKWTSRRILRIGIAALTSLYVGDTLSVRYRMTKGPSPIGSVQIKRFYAIAEKNNRTEFTYGDPTTEECVHSLFPHLGDNPCWYVRRHNEERIEE